MSNSFFNCPRVRSKSDTTASAKRHLQIPEAEEDVPIADPVAAVLDFLLSFDGLRAALRCLLDPDSIDDDRVIIQPDEDRTEDDEDALCPRIAAGLLHPTHNPRPFPNRVKYIKR